MYDMYICISIQDSFNKFNCQILQFIFKQNVIRIKNPQIQEQHLHLNWSRFRDNGFTILYIPIYGQFFLSYFRTVQQLYSVFKYQYTKMSTVHSISATLAILLANFSKDPICSLWLVQIALQIIMQLLHCIACCSFVSVFVKYYLIALFVHC